MLVAELSDLAPDAGTRNVFCRVQGERVARGLQRDAPLRQALLCGAVDLREVLSNLDQHAIDAKAMFHTIQGHHARLRSSPPDPARVSSGWADANGDEEGLKRYAEAASEISKRQWTQMGIDWCAAQAIDFFHNDGFGRHLRKLALKKLKKGPVPQAERDAILAASLREQSSTIQLLDVGSCGSLFSGLEGVEVTALDLCPLEGHSGVYHSDFLALEVGPRGSPPLVSPHPKFNAGSLRRLPANQWDVVVLSLVLSYLPRPLLRASMVAKARRLLRSPPPTNAFGRRGLLLIHETMALDTRVLSPKHPSNLRTWVEAIESLGFVLVRHTTLKRSHALAFAVRPLDAAQLDQLLDEESLPALMLRREMGCCSD